MNELRTELFVGGAWVAASDGATFVVDDPATGKPLADVADAGPSGALTAAVDAQISWGRARRQYAPTCSRLRASTP